MRNKRSKGAVLAISGGSLTFLLASQKNILELPTLLIVVCSLLLMLTGVFMIIRTDLKK